MAKSFQLLSYVLDRLVRILLPLLAALIFIMVVHLMIGEKIDWKEIIGNLFSLQGILVSPATPPLWSLSYEVWFYIFMGAAAYFFTTSRKKGSYFSILALLVCMLVFTVLKFHYLGIWLLAALIYHVPVQRSRPLLLTYAGLSIVAIGLLQISSESKTAVSIDTSLFVSRPVVEVIFSFCIGLFLHQLVLFAPKNSFEEKIDRWGTSLAKFSYTLYLVHFPFFILLLSRFIKKQAQVDFYSITLYVFCLLACCILSYMVYLAAEKHTNVVKRWLQPIIKKA